MHGQDTFTVQFAGITSGIPPVSGIRIVTIPVTPEQHRATDLNLTFHYAQFNIFKWVPVVNNSATSFGHPVGCYDIVSAIRGNRRTTDQNLPK